MSLLHRRLCLLFTPELCTGRPWHTLEEALAGGVDLVQWRVPSPDVEGLQRCMEICAEHSVPVLVNDDVMAAIRARAHGAHVGQEDMPAPVARRLLGDSWLGVSTHDLAQVQRAAHDGADYVGFGPCYPTATKGYEHGLPPSVIEEAVHESPVPVFAIGGIRPNNVNLLVGLGVKRVAVSSVILQAENPRAVAEDLLGRW